MEEGDGGGGGGWRCWAGWVKGNEYGPRPFSGHFRGSEDRNTSRYNHWGG